MLNIYILIFVLAMIFRHVSSFINRSRFRTASAKSLTVASNLFSENDGYLAVHVTGKLTDDSAESFYIKTLENAKNSVLENGISRFDVLHSKDEFLLIEVYNSKQGPDEHKTTKHYNDW